MGASFTSWRRRVKAMTYVRLVRFALEPGNEDPVRALANALVPKIQQQPGCESVVVFIDDEGEAGVLVLWDSPEHANAAASIIRPQLDSHLSSHLTSPPEARLFRVVSG
jgi:heme-degrading monooxygenase HmoA